MAVGDEAQRLRRARRSAGADVDDLSVEAVARERDGDAENLTWRPGEFTFVALDENDKPRAIAAKEE